MTPTQSALRENHQPSEDAAIVGPYDSDGRFLIPSDIPPPCEITARSAADLVGAMVDGTLTSRNVVFAFLKRIELLNPRYNAIVSLRNIDEILAEADTADAYLASGGTPGPLHGLPIAIKDLMPTKGLATTYGSPLFKDLVPEEDGLAAERIRAAGAIIIGKTNTPEFGLGSHTYNSVFGPTGNAFAPALSAGGSSGGAAVALATHMLPIADGSDMGGSLRNPAAWNNVLGLRPTAGRVPSPGSDELFTLPLATEGPMARNAQDLAILLDVLAGPDSRVPLSKPLPAAPFTQIQPVETPLTIGWLGNLGGHLPMEDGLLEANEKALERFMQAGHVVKPVDLAFDFEALWQSFVVLRQHTVATRYRHLLAHPKNAEIKPEMRWELEHGLKLSLDDLRKAHATRSAWYRLLNETFKSFDLLTLPATAVWPFPVEQHWPQAIGEKKMDSYHRWMEVVIHGTLAGLPVLALPTGLLNGLSTGIQIIARPGAEDVLLSLAAECEANAATS